MNDKSGDSPTPDERPRPKRGAVPTPQSEIDKAKPYVPAEEAVDADDAEKTLGTDPNAPSDADAEDEH